ncbi:MAG: hypothetical protein ABII06_11005 [Pseudomonadota bacterium]
MGNVVSRGAFVKKRGLSPVITQHECAGRSEPLSSEQIRKIRSLWDQKPLHEIAGIVGAGEEAVRHFARTHYLFLKYLR